MPRSRRRARSGTRPATIVPRLGADVMSSTPPSAATRSAMLPRPDPGRHSSGSKPDAVVLHGEREMPVAPRPIAPRRSSPARAWTRCSVPRGRRSTPPLRPRWGSDRHPIPRPTLARRGSSPGGAAPSASPCALRTGGWMPCARSPSVSIASRTTRCRSPTMACARAGSRRASVLVTPKLHHQGDQVLLRAIVDVALHLPAFGVLCVDDAPTRGADLRRLGRDRLEAVGELGGETNVAQHQAGLRGEVVQAGAGRPARAGFPEAASR